MFHHKVVDFGNDVESFQYEEWLRREVIISSNGEWHTDRGRIFPFVVRKKYYLAVGGLDTFYNSPNVCDWDMFLKFELLDFWFPRTERLHLYHFGSVVTKKNREAGLFAARQRNAMTEYNWKWGAHPHNEPKTNSKLPPDGQFRGFNV